MALCGQSGLDTTWEMLVRASSRSTGSRSLRMSPLLMARFRQSYMTAVTGPASLIKSCTDRLRISRASVKAKIQGGTSSNCEDSSCQGRMSQGAKGGRVSCDAAKRCGFQTPIMRPNQRGWDNLMHLWHKIAAQFFALKGWSKFATHSGVPRPEANSNESAARFLKSSALTTSDPHLLRRSNPPY
jgi:hypothetical protein